jgi:hypothetical protein
MSNEYPAVPAPTPLYIKVRNSFGAPLKGARVEIYNLRMRDTDKNGTITYVIENDEFNERISTGDEGLIYPKIRKAHHGVRAADGSLPTKAGGFVLEHRVKRGVGFCKGGQFLEWDESKKAYVLSVELVDMVHAREFAVNKMPTGVVGAMKPADAQRAVFICAHRGDFVPTFGREVVSPATHHDYVTPPPGEKEDEGFFAACGDACTHEELPLDARFGALNSTIRGVRFVYFGWSGGTVRQFPSTTAKTMPFISLPTAFNPTASPLENVDPRNLVGLCRLIEVMKQVEPALTAIYHIGINATSSQALGRTWTQATIDALPEGQRPRHDNHGEGRAVDFGGYSTRDPEEIENRLKIPSNKRQPFSFEGNFKDVFVRTHWGGILPYDHTTAPNGADGQENNDAWRRYEGPTEVPGCLPLSVSQTLVYRLLGTLPDLPMDMTPANARPIAAHGKETPEQKATREENNVERAKLYAPLNAQWHELMRKCKTMFERIYDFAEREYSVPLQPSRGIGIDKNHTLHPDFPTASDFKTGADGKIEIFLNGRQAHQDHFHFNIGLTGTQLRKTDREPSTEFGYPEEMQRQAAKRNAKPQAPKT